MALGALVILAIVILVGVAVLFASAIITLRIPQFLWKYSLPIACGFGVVIIVGLFFPTIKGPPRGAWRNYQAKADMHALITACKYYVDEYGVQPTGDNASIVQILHGDNPRKIDFYQLSFRGLNKSGEAIDPWGTPYRISFDGTNAPIIRSAGPNRVFDDDPQKSDDLYSER